jgi:DNA ligase-1
VKGLNGEYKDVEFKIGSGFDDAERIRIWNERDRYLGLIVRFKYFPLGSKDKPRFPTFEGWRSKEDM